MVGRVLQCVVFFCRMLVSKTRTITTVIRIPPLLGGNNSAKYSYVVKKFARLLYFTMIYLCTINKLNPSTHQRVIEVHGRTTERTNVQANSYISPPKLYGGIIRLSVVIFVIFQSDVIILYNLCRNGLPEYWCLII